MLKRHVNSALAAYFFGNELDGKLTIEKFLEFQEHLQRDILRIEVRVPVLRTLRALKDTFCLLILVSKAETKRRQDFGSGICDSAVAT